MLIGEQIAHLRHDLGLTQDALAAQAGVSVDIVRRLEQGQRDSARLATLKAIGRALNAEMTILFTPSRPDGRAPSRGRRVRSPAATPCA